MVRVIKTTGNDLVVAPAVKDSIDSSSVIISKGMQLIKITKMSVMKFYNMYFITHEFGKVLKSIYDLKEISSKFCNHIESREMWRA